MKQQHRPNVQPRDEESHKYVAEINRLEMLNTRLSSEVGLLKSQLKQQHGLKAKALDFYLELDRYILNTIDHRGYKRKAKLHKKAEKINPAEIDGASKEELLKTAHQYDAQSFFRYHAPKTSMKLRYRVASKSYRTGRDIAKKGARKLYHLSGSKGAN